jgi:GWxTD domain-containing protein
MPVKMNHKRLARILGLLGGIVLIWACGHWNLSHLDPESREFYELARLIMSKEEEDIFFHLPNPEARSQFIQEFWDKRDPKPDTEENEYRTEFYRRVNYANRVFREGIPGWKTDRGRIYIYLGPPDKVERRPFMRGPEAKGLIWWGYFDLRLGIWFVDTDGSGRYSIQEYDSTRGENLLQVMERVQREQFKTMGDAFGNRYIDFEIRYDPKFEVIRVFIPVEEVIFKEVRGNLTCTFQFRFYVYKKKGTWSRSFEAAQGFSRPAETIPALEHVDFLFPLQLKNGNYYVDVILIGDQGMGKTRKIFKVTVF